MKKNSLFDNAIAEQEANRVGTRFANSTDVVGDMSRAYGHDFSGVKMHDDASSDAFVHSKGKDAIASGNDIYFGRGILDAGTPEANGLIAHELTHTMQQTGDSGVSESVSFGAEQGGLLSWFKNKFKSKSKKQQAMESEINGLDIQFDGDGYNNHDDADRNQGNLEDALGAQEAKQRAAVGSAPWLERQDSIFQQLKLRQTRKNNSMSDEMKALIRDSKLDERIFQEFVHGYDKGEDGNPLTEADARYKEQDEAMIRAFASGDSAQRLPYLERWTDELGNADITGKMLTPEYIGSHAAESKDMISRMMMYQNVMGDQGNSFFFDSRSDEENSFISDNILDTYATVGTLIANEFALSGVNHGDMRGVSLYNADMAPVIAESAMRTNKAVESRGIINLLRRKKFRR